MQNRSSIRDIQGANPEQERQYRLEEIGRKYGKPYYAPGTPEYQRDLRSRNGGADPGNPEHRGYVQDIVSGITSGVSSEDEIEFWRHRNPAMSRQIDAAIKARNELNKISQISQKYYKPAQPGFLEEGPMQPGVAPEVIPAQEAQYDPRGAIQELTSIGTPEAMRRASEIAAVMPSATERQKGVTLQEVEYLNSLPENQRAAAESQLLRLKRAGQIVEIAGAPNLVNPDRTLTPLSTLPAEALAAGTIQEAKTKATKIAESNAAFVENTPARIEKRRQIIDSIGTVEDKITQALNSIGTFTTGIPGAIGGLVPGTEAYDLDQTLMTIKANLGFDRLQQMRDASPTGGALGQVAVQELVALQSAVASLDKKQSPEVLRRNLNEIRSRYRKWRAALQRAETEESRKYERLTGQKMQKNIDLGDGWSVREK